MLNESNFDFKNVNPVNPIAPYLGGKKLLAKTIIPLIEKIPHQVYAEPFIGMGGIFFRRNNRPRCEAINDINQDIITLYRVLERFYPYFMDLLKYKLCSRAEFNRLKEQTPETLLDFERAARYLYLQKNAFGGNTVNQSFGVDLSKGARFDISRLIPHAEELHERLQGVIIECLPYQIFIQKYDREFTLFYLDPPYWNCENDYGKGIFGKADFDNLAKLLGEIKGRFILSINDVPEIRRIFSDFYIMEVNTRYSISTKSGQSKEAAELLISNININCL